MKGRFGTLRCSPPCLAAIALIGCTDSTEPLTGSIKATVTTTSAVEDRDADGYLLRVEPGPQFLIGVSGVLTIGDVEAGMHAVSLEGLAPNCTVTSANPVNVDVVTSADPGVTTPVSFSVVCVPRVGSIRVLITTSGEDPDADGYSLNVAGRFHTGIPVNGTRTFSGLRDGANAVTLTGVAGNCTVPGAPTKTVAVTYGGTSDVQFDVTCVAAGSVRVTTSTTGFFAESMRHWIELRQSHIPGPQISLPPMGTGSFTGLMPGVYRLEVLYVVPNCEAAIPGSREIVVASGAPTDVLVEVNCPTPGRIVFVSNASGNEDISVMNSTGSGLSRLTFEAQADVSPAWSPDGSRIAFASDRDGNREIYVMNADGTNQVRLTNIAGRDDTPAWSPDGKRIAFASDRNGDAEIYVMNADGTNHVRVTTSLGSDAEPTWSPDGSMIAFASTRHGVSSIWVMKSDGSDPVQVGTGALAESQPAWSPDGSRIAFSLRVTGVSNAIILTRPDGSGRTAVTSAREEASNPAWSPDGRRILFTERECFSDFYYGNYCNDSLRFIGVGGVAYSYYVLGRISDASWQP